MRIKKAGKPVARMRKYAGYDKNRTPGTLKGQIRIADDFDSMPDDSAVPFGYPKNR